MGQNDTLHGEILPDAADDRPLTGVEKQRLARGHELAVGNGCRPGFHELPPETLAQYRAKGIETRRQNREAKKLMERAAYLEAHKQHAALILGGRLALVEGLLEELIDPVTQKPSTKGMNEKRLQLLQTMLNDFDKGMGMAPQAKADTQTLDVNVTHTVAQIVKSLEGGK